MRCRSMDVVDVVGDSLTDRFECLAADALHGVVDGVPCRVEAIVRVMLDDVDGRNAGLDEFYMIIGHCATDLVVEVFAISRVGSRVPYLVDKPRSTAH